MERGLRAGGDAGAADALQGEEHRGPAAPDHAGQRPAHGGGGAPPACCNPGHSEPPRNARMLDARHVSAEGLPERALRSQRCRTRACAPTCCSTTARGRRSARRAVRRVLAATASQALRRLRGGARAGAVGGRGRPAGGDADLRPGRAAGLRRAPRAPVPAEGSSALSGELSPPAGSWRSCTTRRTSRCAARCPCRCSSTSGGRWTRRPCSSSCSRSSSSTTPTRRGAPPPGLGPLESAPKAPPGLRHDPAAAADRGGGAG